MRVLAEKGVVSVEALPASPRDSKEFLPALTYMHFRDLAARGLSSLE